MTMTDQPSLATERLLLRPFALADAAAVQTLAGDSRVAEMTAHIPHPYPDGEAEQWIASHAAEWREGRLASFAVTLRDTGKLIGTVSLMNIHNHEAEIGYWIGVPYWNEGYCTEAVDALIGFGMTSLELTRLYAHHLSRNPASGRVLRNVGLKKTGKESIVHRGIATETVDFYELILGDEMLD